MGVLQIALVWAAGVQAPVPRREYQEIAGPECGGRKQQLRGRFLMRGKGRNQQRQGGDTPICRRPGASTTTRIPGNCWSRVRRSKAEIAWPFPCAREGAKPAAPGLRS